MLNYQYSTKFKGLFGLHCITWKISLCRLLKYICRLIWVIQILLMPKWWFLDTYKPCNCFYTYFPYLLSISIRPSCIMWYLNDSNRCATGPNTVVLYSYAYCTIFAVRSPDSCTIIYFIRLESEFLLVKDTWVITGKLIFCMQLVCYEILCCCYLQRYTGCFIFCAHWIAINPYVNLSWHYKVCKR